MEQDQQGAVQEQVEVWVVAKVGVEWAAIDLEQGQVDTAFVQVVGQKCLIR